MKPSDSFIETGGASGRDREALATLRRRHDHLVGRAEDHDEADNWDSREANALDWALQLAGEVKRRGGLAEIEEAHLRLVGEAEIDDNTLDVLEGSNEE